MSPSDSIQPSAFAVGMPRKVVKNRRVLRPCLHYPPSSTAPLALPRQRPARPGALPPAPPPPSPPSLQRKKSPQIYRAARGLVAGVLIGNRRVAPPGPAAALVAAPPSFASSRRDVDQSRADVDQSRADVAQPHAGAHQLSPDVDRAGIDAGPSWSDVDRSWPDVDRSWPDVVGSGPAAARPDRWRKRLSLGSAADRAANSCSLRDNGYASDD